VPVDPWGRLERRSALPRPERPKIYHITHAENLPQIIDHVLWSDAERIRQALDCQIVGMGEIKPKAVGRVGGGLPSWD